MFWRVILATAFIAAGLLLFVFSGFSKGHSSQFNYTWVVHYINAFSWGAPLPRHLPGLWSGLGGYDFFFYAPLPFWFIAAFVTPICLGCSPETQFVLGAAFFWLLSGFTFYLFLRRYFDMWYATFGAVFYAILPYHLWIDWFVRQAVGEFVAYAFIPLIAIGCDAIRLNERHGWTLSIGIAGTAFCHLPTALLAGHVFGVIALFVFWEKARKKQDALGFLGSIVGWTVLGGLLSCFYWLPALTLLDTVSPNVLYSSHFIAEQWLFGLHFDQPNPSFASIVLFSFLATLPFVAVSATLSRGAIQVWILVPVALSLFLNIEISEFVWKNWIIKKVQFPWRLMVFVDFSAAIAITFALRKFEPFYKGKVFIVLVFLAMAPAIKVGQTGMYSAIAEYKKFNDWGGAGEYLSAEMLAVIKSRYDGHVPSQADIASEVQEISIELAETAPLMSIQISPRRATITTVQDVPRLSVPVQYWFLWRAELEGNIPLKLSANPRLGTIEIIAPINGLQGRTITLTLPYHYSEKIGLVVSFLSLMLLIAAIINSLGIIRRNLVETGRVAR